MRDRGGVLSIAALRARATSSSRPAPRRERPSADPVSILRVGDRRAGEDPDVVGQVDDGGARGDDVAVGRRLQKRLQDDRLVAPFDAHRRAVHRAVRGDGRDDGFDDHNRPRARQRQPRSFGCAVPSANQIHRRRHEAVVAFVPPRSPRRGVSAVAMDALAAVGAGRQRRPSARDRRAGSGRASRSRTRSPPTPDETARRRQDASRCSTAMISPSSSADAMTRSDVGQRRARDDERVIASDPERRGQPGEHARPSCDDGRRSAVPRPAGADDVAAVRGADALVAEAHAENRDRRAEAPDDVGRDARPRRASTDRAR